MRTDCNGVRFEFQPLARRKVVADFNGGRLSSDGGALLLREIEERFGLIDRFAQCFTDHRDQSAVEHSSRDLIAQRVYALALGYEDLNDHDELRKDELLAVAVGKKDVTGADRARERDKGSPLAGKSTLNRLELAPPDADASSRYKKIVADEKALANVWTDLYIATQPARPERIVIDLDATDDPIHGAQEGRFFHGYYDEYCYLPLYIFIDDCLVWAELRPSSIDGAAGSEAALLEILGRLWQEWPGIEIIVRADSGFCRENIMRLCEAWPGVDYVFGLAKNKRLLERIEPHLERAEATFEETGEAARVFEELRYKTRKSWSRVRRVVAKAEHLRKGPNPRFVVTSLPAETIDARTLYEDLYCARGEMENRIKEQQLDLFADRTSTSQMRSNQLRLWFSSLAYTLMEVLRRLGLAGTKMSRCQCGTIRLRLFKIAARIRVSVRRVLVSMADGCPYAGEFAQAFENLTRLHPLRA
jgi:hypothetical protein